MPRYAAKAGEETPDRAETRAEPSDAASTVSSIGDEVDFGVSDDPAVPSPENGSPVPVSPGWQLPPRPPSFGARRSMLARTSAPSGIRLLGVATGPQLSNPYTVLGVAEEEEGPSERSAPVGLAHTATSPPPPAAAFRRSEDMHRSLAKSTSMISMPLVVGHQAAPCSEGGVGPKGVWQGDAAVTAGPVAPVPQTPSSAAGAAFSSATTNGMVAAPAAAGAGGAGATAGGSGGMGPAPGTGAVGNVAGTPALLVLPPYPLRPGPGEDDEVPSLWSYIEAETQPAEKLPTAGVVWGQTERERVYNFLLHVPYQLERLIMFGFLILVDSFLGVFTLLPLRCAAAVVQLLVGLVLPRRGGAPSSVRRPSLDDGGPPAASAPSLHANLMERAAPSTSTAPTPTGAFASAVAAAAAAASASGVPATPSASFVQPNPQLWGAGAGRGSLGGAGAGGGAGAERRSCVPPGRYVRLSGSQLYDLLCLVILCSAAAVLRAVRPGSIYYWLKDITSEFLKMSVLSSAFDISDKILSNFGNDVLEALSGTCTQWLAGKKRLGALAADALVAWLIVLLHALTLMIQALIVAVALNSTRNGLVALLIANNFVEIKSTVFKKWDTTRLWALVCADMVERFHLVVVLAFVVVEEMDSAASWAPPHDYMRVCGLMVAAEVVIDVVKHAVLGKFSDVRPGIYREFHQELCTKALAAQSHSAPRLLNFHHLAPAVLALRIGVTLFWLRVESHAQVWVRLALVLALYLALLVAKLLCGYWLKLLAANFAQYYAKHYSKHHGTRAGPGSRAAVTTMASAMPAPGMGGGPAAAAGSGPSTLWTAAPPASPRPATAGAGVAAGGGAPPVSPRVSREPVGPGAAAGAGAGLAAGAGAGGGGSAGLSMLLTARTGPGGAGKRHAKDE